MDGQPHGLGQGNPLLKFILLVQGARYQALMQMTSIYMYIRGTKFRRR